MKNKDKKIYYLIDTMLPEYIKEEFPLYTSLIESYLKYLDNGAEKDSDVITSNTTYVPTIEWNFTNTTLGWTSINTSIIPSQVYIKLNNYNSDPIILSPALSINGNDNYIIRARIRRTSGNNWDGTCFYSTSGHSMDFNYRKQISDITVLNQWVTVEWDMRNLTVGGNDWINNDINQIRLDFGGEVNDNFDIDWISIGSFSTVINGENTELDEDKGIAHKIYTVTDNTHANTVFTELIDVLMKERVQYFKYNSLTLTEDQKRKLALASPIIAADKGTLPAMNMVLSRINTSLDKLFLTQDNDVSLYMRSLGIDYHAYIGPAGQALDFAAAMIPVGIVFSLSSFFDIIDRITTKFGREAFEFNVGLIPLYNGRFTFCGTFNTSIIYPTCNVTASLYYNTQDTYSNYVSGTITNYSNN